MTISAMILSGPSQKIFRVIEQNEGLLAVFVMDPSSSDVPPAPENPCKEYWSYKRKRMRENKKQSKLAAKAPKLEEAASPSETRSEETKSNPKKWKNVDISEIEFHTPTIVIDLSFEEKMNQKVRGHFLSSLPSTKTSPNGNLMYHIALEKFGLSSYVFLLRCGP